MKNGIKIATTKEKKKSNIWTPERDIQTVYGMFEHSTL